MVVVPVLDSACSFEYYLSMNNNGEILGRDQACADGTEPYFTCDPVNGTQSIAVPSASGTFVSALPIAANDDGQVLITITTTSGAYNWGVLNPVSSSSASARRAQLRKHAAPSQR